jgi:hypothetical protein
MTKNGDVIATYCSMTEAEKQTKIYKSNISSVINGKRKTAGGYIWKGVD